MNSHLNKVRQWAMFRSTTATAANGVVPLVLRGQDVRLWDRKDAEKNN